MRPFLFAIAFFVSLVIGIPCAYAELPTDREYNVRVMERIAGPVLRAAAEGRLREDMPLGPGEENRRDFTHLEAFGRTMAGIAPWLALGADNSAEGRLRGAYAALAVKCLIQVTAADSPNRLNFTKGSQPLVDAAFMAMGLLRAPQQLWQPLTEAQRRNVLQCLRDTRKIKAPENNWLLFSALVEAVLWEFGGEVEMPRIENALEKHEQWYVGDGIYGDGPEYHWDYYNSFVIQPALILLLQVCQKHQSPLAAALPVVRERARRYAEVQERLISPEGTFPVIGRSSSYRFGAFQTLSLMALQRDLPESVPPAAVRSALTAVIRRMVEAPGTFDENGWLRVGIAGAQPAVRDTYVSTGSLYICLCGMLHLGLPANDPFWTAPAQAWTQKRLWSGENVPADHKLKSRPQR